MHFVIRFCIDFKKENGFHGMPSVFADKSESPYNIPVIGQEKMIDYGSQGGSQFGDIADNFNNGMEDLAPISDFGGDHYNFNDDDDGFDTGASPFKYHHDVSSNGLKGDSHGFNDQVRIYHSNIIKSSNSPSNPLPPKK